MTTLEEVGEADGWRCWLCDEPVDPDRSVNDERGPSVDRRVTKRKAKKKAAVAEAPRLAHRSCNTGKGNVAPSIAWPDHLFVVDPAVIISSVEHLTRKGGREVMARCPTEDDADQAGTWLVDRISRLEPRLRVTAHSEPGGGQFLLVLSVD